jgi:hypothetical protein
VGKKEREDETLHLLMHALSISIASARLLTSLNM